MQVDFAAKEITMKLVYYGPARSGKTSNLRAIHWLGTSLTSGTLMTFETPTDRTLFFDMLPMTMRLNSGLKVRLKLFAVPGQLMHEATRRMVLQSADGVAFVADSQKNEADANRESFRSLERNLEQNRIDPQHIPIVIQFNKRDLDDIRTDQELNAMAERSREPIYKAIATRGHGVMQTLLGLIEQTWTVLDSEHRMEQELGVHPRRFMREIESQLRHDARRLER